MILQDPHPPFVPCQGLTPFLIWSTHEWPLRFGLPKGGLSVVVEGSQTPKPQTSIGLGSNETPHGQVAPPCPYLPSLSFGTLWRHHLRQEPSAVAPHARICAGGAGQPASLPRPLISHFLLYFRICPVSRAAPIPFLQDLAPELR